MPRPAIQLGVLHGHLPRQNAAVIQGCVPLVITEGQDSYRLRGKDLDTRIGAKPTEIS
jgi:hypothetical protein